MHSAFRAPIFGVMLIFTMNIMIFAAVFTFSMSLRRITLKGSVSLIFNESPNYSKSKREKMFVPIRKLGI